MTVVYSPFPQETGPIYPIDYSKKEVEDALRPHGHSKEYKELIKDESVQYLFRDIFISESSTCDPTELRSKKAQKSVPPEAMDLMLSMCSYFSSADTEKYRKNCSPSCIPNYKDNPVFWDQFYSYLQSNSCIYDYDGSEQCREYSNRILYKQPDYQKSIIRGHWEDDVNKRMSKLSDMADSLPPDRALALVEHITQALDRIIMEFSASQPTIVVPKEDHNGADHTMLRLLKELLSNRKPCNRADSRNYVHFQVPDIDVSSDDTNRLRLEDAFKMLQKNPDPKNLTAARTRYLSYLSETEPISDFQREDEEFCRYLHDIVILEDDKLKDNIRLFVRSRYCEIIRKYSSVSRDWPNSVVQIFPPQSHFGILINRLIHDTTDQHREHFSDLIAQLNMLSNRAQFLHNAYEHAILCAHRNHEIDVNLIHQVFDIMFLRANSPTTSDSHSYIIVSDFLQYFSQMWESHFKEKFPLDLHKETNDQQLIFTAAKLAQAYHDALAHLTDTLPTISKEHSTQLHSRLSTCNYVLLNRKVCFSPLLYTESLADLTHAMLTIILSALVDPVTESIMMKIHTLSQ